MSSKLAIYRDRLLLKSPAARSAAERGMLAVARLNRALGARPGGRNIVVFHAGRSGSQVLAGLLAQHPDIFWDNELFWAARLRTYRDIYGDAFDPMEIIRLAPFKTRKPWYGWEMKPNHFRLAELDRAACIEQLKVMGYDRFIVLRRKSLLRQFLSMRLLKSQEDRSRTHVRADDDVQRRQIDIDTLAFLNFARVQEEDFNDLAHDLAGEQVLQLTYEDHIEQDPRNAQRRVCDFMGVAPHEARVTLRRGNPFPLREIIRNYDEVASDLSGTAYAYMLEQDQ